MVLLVIDGCEWFAGNSLAPRLCFFLNRELQNFHQRHSATYSSRYSSRYRESIRFWLVTEGCLPKRLACARRRYVLLHALPQSQTMSLQHHIHMVLVCAPCWYTSSRLTLSNTSPTPMIHAPDLESRATGMTDHQDRRSFAPRNHQKLSVRSGTFDVGPFQLGALYSSSITRLY